MNFTQSFKLAIKSLLLSKMRALLTMLGKMCIRDRVCRTYQIR